VRSSWASISDTHGLLRPEAVAALRGSDLIIHAGDVGNPTWSRSWPALRPPMWCAGISTREIGPRSCRCSRSVDVGERLFYVLHEISQLDLDPAEAGFAAVVFGIRISP